MTFAEMELHPSLLKGIADLGFERPTPIQEEAIPHILGGKDVIACAATGTGKTAAFLLPILHRLLAGQRVHGPRALVLAPTRELAQQSQDHLAGLSRHIPLRGAAVYGGVPMPPQIRALAQGVDVLSATPGRLLDHASARRVAFGGVRTFVLDEADRMLDMGFLPDLRRIVALLPKERQTVIVSATIPDEIMHLIRSICRDPVTVQIGPKARPPVGIRHAVYPVSHEQKLELLLRLLSGMGEVSSVIIFVRTKERADRLATFIERAGIRVAVLHGDRDQRERQQALEAFRSGERQVLVATDVAARGLDIKDVTHVINYDLPDAPESYVHRIGRTGRAEAEGDAFSLMAPEEEGWILAVERMLGSSLPRITLPDFTYRKPFAHGSYHPRPYYIGDKKPGPRRGGGGGFGGGGFRRR